MAIGDDAAGAGYELVPETGENGKVKYGARELNRGRDYTAQVKNETRPVARGGTGGTTRATARSGIGITVGSAAPSNPQVGDLWFEPI